MAKRSIFGTINVKVFILNVEPASVPMHVTITDVAKKAGVSIATVSRAFNKGDKVKECTRKRILQIAQQLKYTPNAAARGLITNRHDAIGLLLPDLHGEFFSEVIRGADKAARAAGYHLIVSSSHDSQDEIENALRLMRGRLDALVVMSPQIDSGTLLNYIPRALPVVFLNSEVNSAHYDCISVNGYGGAYDATSYLIGLGHTRIALIRGCERNREALERLYGYRAALRDAGLPEQRHLEWDGDFTEESGFAAAQHIVSMKPRPTAIFASNDTMAIGAIGALHELGVRIPEDISICGFDDIPIAQHLRPALTSVHVPIYDLGQMAVKNIVERIQKGRSGKPLNLVIAPTLSVRSSCRRLIQKTKPAKEAVAS